MDRLKNCYGITLIVLIITIIVLVIITTVSIKSISGGNGIPTKAKAAKEFANKEADKQKIKTVVLQASINGTLNRNKIIEQLGTSWTVSGEIPWICKSLNGNIFMVSADGTIRETSVINLNKKILRLELSQEKISTAEITVTLNGIEGDITWNNTDNTKASIVQNGNKVIVTANSIGQTTITATCGEYTDSCTVIIKEPIQLEIGDYIQYNLPYTDICTGYEFTSNNGWRYIGKDDNGNFKIVSTGLPAEVYYNYNENSGYINNGWWATDEEVTSEYGAIYSSNGYNYENSGYTNRYVAYGLKYKFTSIIFEYVASREGQLMPNKGRYIKIGTKKSGKLPANAFIIGNNVIGVRSLTLEDLNSARKLDSSSVASLTVKDGDIGLFYLRNLIIENSEFGYTESTRKCNYWLATFNSNDNYNIFDIGYAGDIRSDNRNQNAIRPVITLSSASWIEDTNSDGVFEIIE